MHVVAFESEHLEFPTVDPDERRQDLSTHSLDLLPDPVVHDGYSRSGRAWVSLGTARNRTGSVQPACPAAIACVILHLGVLRPADASGSFGDELFGVCFDGRAQKPGPGASWRVTD
jgi:hypothetical protein